MAVVMLAVEGVLAQENEPIPASQPVRLGVSLYHSLKDQFRIVLVSSNDAPEKVKHWLDTHGLTEHPWLLCREPEDEHLDLVSLRTKQLDICRAKGLTIEYFIDASPSVAAMALYRGVVGLLFFHPRFARPEYLPDAPREIRQWSDIEAEIDRQTRARAKRSREDVE